MQRIETKNAPAPIGPYNQAIAHGGVLYVSGQIGSDPETGKLIAGDLEAETRQVMKNLKAVLEAGGSSIDHLIKCSIFFLDMGNFARINEIYGSFFNGHFPARETVEVSALPAGARVEISAIAEILP